MKDNKIHFIKNDNGSVTRAFVYIDVITLAALKKLALRSSSYTYMEKAALADFAELLQKTEIPNII